MTDITLTHSELAEVRGEVYKLLSWLTAYPTESLLQKIRCGQLNSSLTILLEKLPYKLSLVPLTIRTDCHVASEYLRLFELPGDIQPCPLYGGLFESDRKTVMEELLRLYRLFGLTIHNAPVRDTPDSITTVLEFLQYLCTLESKAAIRKEAIPCRKAQRDLLQRHLTLWTPRIVERVNEKKPPPVYKLTVTLLNDYCNAELAALQD
jgi:DMSO reductase family type II enzyme chaperone